VETIDTLIIGAGPAGLTTAYSLVKAGNRVLVIDKTSIMSAESAGQSPTRAFYSISAGIGFFRSHARW